MELTDRLPWIITLPLTMPARFANRPSSLLFACDEAVEGLDVSDWRLFDSCNTVLGRLSTADSAVSRDSFEDRQKNIIKK